MSIKKARERIERAFKEDPDFRQGYVDNVACIIMDNIPGYKKNKSKRDTIANKIIKHLFE